MEEKILSVQEETEMRKRLREELEAAAPEREDAAKTATKPGPCGLMREAILKDARHCVCGIRNEDYGTPEDSFGLIADLWSAYTGCGIDAKDVAVMMVLLKAARIAGGSQSMDNWIDIAGYAACGGEIMARRKA